MTIAERQDYVRAMLCRYREAISQGSLGASMEAHGDRVLLFPPTWNAAMRELDRTLDLMRSEPVLRWHTVAWYVDIQYRQVQRFRTVYKRNGNRAKMPAGWMLEERRHRAASLSKADEGVAWLADRFEWHRIHLKAIHEAAGLVALAA